MTDQLILIVEDDPENRRLIQQVIEEFVGVRTALASDGAEAIERVYEYKPDLILLDILLPMLDGGDVARWLKADPTTRKIPIIAVTANCQDAGRRGLIADCDACVEKPFDLDALVNAVFRLLTGGQAASAAC